LEKNPETQTRPKKNPDLVEKPAITIPFARWRRHSGELTVNPIVVVVVVVVI